MQGLQAVDAGSKVGRGYSTWEPLVVSKPSVMVRPGHTLFSGPSCSLAPCALSHLCWTSDPIHGP